LTNIYVFNIYCLVGGTHTSYNKLSLSLYTVDIYHSKQMESACFAPVNRFFFQILKTGHWFQMLLEMDSPQRKVWEIITFPCTERSFFASFYTSQLTMCSYSFNHPAFLTFIRNICFLESLDLYSRESSWSAILLLLYQFVVFVVNISEGNQWG
jgi:hypothetical protein